MNVVLRGKAHSLRSCQEQIWSRVSPYRGAVSREGRGVLRSVARSICRGGSTQAESSSKDLRSGSIHCRQWKILEDCLRSSGVRTAGTAVRASSSYVGFDFPNGDNRCHLPMLMQCITRTAAPAAATKVTKTTRYLMIRDMTEEEITLAHGSGTCRRGWSWAMLCG